MILHIQINALSTVILKATAHACSVLLEPLPRRAIMHAHPSKIPGTELNEKAAVHNDSSILLLIKHLPGFLTKKNTFASS